MAYHANVSAYVYIRAREETNVVAKETSGSELMARHFTDDELADIRTIGDAANIFGDSLVDASEEMGNGFVVLDDKARLLDVPFLILTWDWRQGNVGGFVSVTLITGKDEKLILNDGSTGIYQQLKDYEEKTGKVGGVICKKGLRVSRYDVETDDGPKKAETYYLNLS